MRLKEIHGGRIVLITLAASPPPRELILRALAMGADEAVLILDRTAGEADSLATALILSRAVSKLPERDVVLCGEGSLDDYSRQVGPRLGEALRLPVLTQVGRIEIANGKLIAERGLEDRTETVESAVPALVTVGQEINRPRLPTVLQILGAARKPVIEWRLTDLGFGRDGTAAGLSGVRTLEVRAPIDARGRVDVPGDGAEAVARNLARELFERGLVKIR